METKFTKGEWLVAERIIPRGFTLIVTDCGDNICRLNKKRELANAKLIAAAPIGFENHVINSGHCDSLIEMIEDGRIEAAKRLIAYMKDNCEYSIKKATE